MVYPPGQGEFGTQLTQLWRRYLEQNAVHEDSVEGQVVAAAYHSAEVFGVLTLILDRSQGYRLVIEQRIGYFEEGVRRAATFEDRLINASFTLYNHTNTLVHLLGEGNPEAEGLIDAIDEQVRVKIQGENAVARSAAALRAVFPLLSLLTLVADRAGTMTSGIRQVEQRFAAGAAASPSPGPQLVNALYRTVEMMQLFAVACDRELSGQVSQVAARFKEEDASQMMLKLRNGFCRLFELSHLLATHLD